CRHQARARSASGRHRRFRPGRSTPDACSASVARDARHPGDRGIRLLAVRPAPSRHRPPARDPRRSSRYARDGGPRGGLAGGDGREDGSARRPDRRGARRAPRATWRAIQGVGHYSRKHAGRLRLPDRRAARRARRAMSRLAWLSGVSLVVSCAALGRVPNLALAPTRFLWLFSAAFACYALAAWLLRHARGMAVIAPVLVIAVLTRLALLPATPSLSTDAYRYLWDARVARAGISPYVYP